MLSDQVIIAASARQKDCNAHYLEQEPDPVVTGARPCHPPGTQSGRRLAKRDKFHRGALPRQTSPARTKPRLSDSLAYILRVTFKSKYDVKADQTKVRSPPNGATRALTSKGAKGRQHAALQARLGWTTLQLLKRFTFECRESVLVAAGCLRDWYRAATIA